MGLALQSMPISTRGITASSEMAFGLINPPTYESEPGLFARLVIHGNLNQTHFGGM